MTRSNITFGVIGLATTKLAPQSRARWIELLLGALSILAAIFTFFDPFAGALTLVMLIGAWLLVIGLFEIAGAWRAVHDHGWRLLLGLLDTILGGLLLFSGPVTGLGFLALAVGFSFLLRGTFLVVLATHLRRLDNA